MTIDPNVCTRCGAKREEWYGRGYRELIWPCSHRQIGEHTQGCNHSSHPSSGRWSMGCSCVAARERVTGEYIDE